MGSPGRYCSVESSPRSAHHSHAAVDAAGTVCVLWETWECRPQPGQECSPEREPELLQSLLSSPELPQSLLSGSVHWEQCWPVLSAVLNLNSHPLLQGLHLWDGSGLGFGTKENFFIHHETAFQKPICCVSYLCVVWVFTGLFQHLVHVGP